MIFYYLNSKSKIVSRRYNIFIMECCFNTDNNGDPICLTSHYANECESYCSQSRCNAGGYPPCISCCPCLIPCLLTIDILLSPCFLYYKCKENKKENNSYNI